MARDHFGYFATERSFWFAQPVVLQTFFAAFLFDAPQMQSIVKVSGQHISGTEKKKNLLLSTRGVCVAFSHGQIQITAVTYRKFALQAFFDISKKKLKQIFKKLKQIIHKLNNLPNIFVLLIARNFT